MNNELEKRLLERQPNSEQREEFLIVLEYLLNEAYDEHHATTQKEIVDYASNKYNFYIRRDRIPQILTHLIQLSEKYPDKFPFKIKVIKMNKIFKCYVEERMFSDKEIIDILSSIINDPTKSYARVNNLKEKILNLTANKHKQIKLNKSLEKVNRKVKRLNSQALNTLSILEDARENKLRIKFTLTNILKFSSSYSGYHIRKKLKEDRYLQGYVYLFIENDQGNQHAIIYLDAEKEAIDVNIDDIILLDKPIDMGDWADGVDFELKRHHRDTFTNIDEWIDQHYRGEDGYNRTIIIKTTYMVDGMETRTFRSFKHNYEEYWKKPLEFETKERIIDYPGDEQEERKIVCLDAYINMSANMNSFKNWYMRYEIFSNVVIIYPSHLNELLIAPLAERLLKRINKYGGTYEYEFERKYRPEYLEALEARRKEREERLNREMENSIQEEEK